MTHKILIVDDDAHILSAFRRAFHKTFDIHTASSAQEGLEIIRSHGPFAVVLSDQQMPQMDGITFLAHVKAQAPHSVRLMLTGNTDQSTAIKAVNEGNIFRFLNKPCAPDEFVGAIKAALRQYELITAERDLLEKTLAGSIKLLTDVLATANPEAFQKTARVRTWGKILVRSMPQVQPWELDMAILLSEIGNVLLPHDLAAKYQRGDVLSDVEQEILSHTPEVASKLIMNIPRMDAVAQAILYRNRGFDGSGYPSDGPAGEELPITARILHILHDLAQDSVQRWPTRQSFEQLAQHAGRYDPALLSRIRDVLLSAQPQQDHTQETFLDLAIVDLRVGDELQKNVMRTNGQILLSAPFILTDAIIQKIFQFHKIDGVRQPISIKRVVV